MIAGLFLAMLAADPAATPGCADHWVVAINRDSFANNGAGRRFGAAQLAVFRTKVDAQLKSAVGAACTKGAVKAAQARKVSRVEVFSASGATEPHLFPAPDGSLTFEWIFAEEGLATPAAKDIIDGAACWTDPKSGACLAPGD